MKNRYTKSSRTAIDFLLRFLLEKIHVEGDIAHNMLSTRALKAEWFHIDILIDGQRRPLSLQKRKANSSRWNLGTSFDGKDEVEAGTRANVSVFVLV